MPFLVAYLKLRVAHGEVESLGIFLGGVTATREEAEQLARDCVNNQGRRGCLDRGGVVLPRVWEMDSDDLIDHIYRAEEWFEKWLTDIQDTAQVVMGHRRN